ncbi:MAG: hypothetical protein CMJ78_02975 [Planctomycetaceae bacterium]|nr:hypothetical protein [Planctomycetaceae bacterium]
MQAATILVYEPSRRWVPELQRKFEGEDVRIRACRSLADLSKQIREEAQAGFDLQGVVVIDLKSGAAECLQFLGSAAGQSRDWAKVVIGSKQNAELEWPLRELGAVGFFSEFVPGSELSRLCRRHLASRAEY